MPYLKLDFFKQGDKTRASNVLTTGAARELQSRNSASWKITSIYMQIDVHYWVHYLDFRNLEAGMSKQNDELKRRGS